MLSGQQLSTSTGHGVRQRMLAAPEVRLSASGVGVEFAGLTALADISLHVARGEIVGLIGPNGAGKTTLLNVLSGYQRATGSVSLGGRDVTTHSTHRLVSLGVARTFQAVRPFPELSTFENVMTGALAATKRTGQARAHTTAMLLRMGLQDWADQPARSLPYGLQRLLGLARALATEPTFLLMDEPAAGLLEVESAALRSTLATVRDEFGYGMLIVEHDMALVMNLCDRVHVLDSGRTLAEGTPDEVRTDPQVLRAYLGTAGVA